MPEWPIQPRIYQVNTWPWLRELSDQLGRTITLADLEPEMLPPDARYFDAIWFMGVWTRSTVGREIAQALPALHEECRRNLPDLVPADLVGSAFSIYAYEIEPELGGIESIQHARDLLHDQGYLLVLDFIPNHVGPDCPWLIEHPDWFMQGTPAELEWVDHGVPAFVEIGGNIFAHGRDPYFPPWIDTIQVRSFSAGLREAYIDTLRQIAGLCDGIRCDTAMLLVSRIVSNTWGGRAGTPLPTEFWETLIPAVKSEFPNFKFIAEVYWGMERELLQQGFDFCYDKEFYDKLIGGSPSSIRAHLGSDLTYQQKLVRFLENHDEPRSTAQLGVQRAKAAGLLVLSAPGAKLALEGQFQGHLLKVPTQLGRRQREQTIPNIEDFYHILLPFLQESTPEGSTWQLIRPEGAWDSDPEDPFVAYLWDSTSQLVLVVVNYSSRAANATVRLPVEHQVEATFGEWEIFDLFTNQSLTYSTHTLYEYGISFVLPPWGTSVMRLRPL